MEQHEWAFWSDQYIKNSGKSIPKLSNDMYLTIWLARRSAAKIRNVFISLKQEQSFPNDPIYNDSQNCKVPKVKVKSLSCVRLFATP